MSSPLAVGIMPTRDGTKKKEPPAFSSFEWKKALMRMQKMSEYYSVPIGGIQCFLCGPIRYNSLVAAETKKDTYSHLRNIGGRVIVHGNYMDSVAFRESHSGCKWARKHMASLMRECQEFNGEGVIAHLPDAEPNVIVETCLSVINQWRSSCLRGAPTSRLILETSAKRPSVRGYSKPEELVGLVSALDSRNLIGHDGVSICIDSAHVWAQGYRDIRTWEGAESLIRPFVEAMPSIVPIYVHLNDDYNKCGSGSDRHAPQGMGRIWGGMDLSDSGVTALVDVARESKGLAVLERREAHIPDDFIALQGRNGLVIEW